VFIFGFMLYVWTAAC